MSGFRVADLLHLLGRRPFSRRAAMQATTLGVTAAVLRRADVAAGGDVSRPAAIEITGAPAAQSTPGACPAGSTDEVYMDGAWLCRQSYALCTRAGCKPSPDD